MIRWSLRLYRREWRQQALALVLLTFAVTVCIVSTTAAYHLAPVGTNAVIGDATHRIEFDGSDPALLKSDLASVDAWFGETEHVTRESVLVAGLFDPLEIRGQDPEGPYGAPMLALLDGRFPSGASEVALTDQIGRALGLGIGDTLEAGGVARTVVGFVENPANLRAEFVLVDPLHHDRPDAVSVLVESNLEQVFGFRSESMSLRASRAEGEAAVAVLAMLGQATVMMVFVALVSAVSFVVLAQRRLRQLGMLAALGATERHLRLVMVANGVSVGITSAIVGGALALMLWVTIVPFLEEPFGHRIPQFGVPWWLVVAAMALSVATATIASWWPARMAARLPVTVALSGRPPEARLSHGSAVLAVSLVATGVGVLVVTGRTGSVLTVIGTLLTIAGVLLLSPLAIRLLATVAGRVPVASRLALRDLARYQSRSAAALAALVLALGMAAVVTLTASAAADAGGLGNLSDRQLVVRLGDPDAPILPPDFSPFVPVRTPAELAAAGEAVAVIGGALGTTRILQLDVAHDPAMGVDDRFDSRSGVTLSRYVEDDRPGYRDLALVYVATPELLAYYGVSFEPDEADPETLTTEEGPLWLTGTPRQPGVPPEQLRRWTTLRTAHSSLPGSFVTPAEMRARGWEPLRAGWLLEAGDPLTDDAIARARLVAADAGLTIEFRERHEDLLALRSAATGAGMAVALGVIALTVGLIRTEGARDMRTLTASGATSGTRRVLTATTASALAFLGVVLGVGWACLVLAAGYLGGEATLRALPVGHLVLMLAGVTSAAGLGGWLVSGGQPSTLSRQPLE